MTRSSRARRALALLAAVLVIAAVSPEAGAEKRVALVIGNSAYPMAPLRNPINDARAMARALNGLGFEVLLRTNVSQREMVELLRDFGARLGRDGVALFYYSGHGMQVKGRNFLIPVDADIRGEDEVPYMSLDVAQVLDKLESARSRANIVILDACRNNPFVRTFRSGRQGLAQMDAPVGTMIAFATAPGSEARDGDSDFGTYTRHLLKHLPSPALPIEVMFRRVREGVTAETGDRQVPWESSSLKGEFYFNPGTAAAQPPPAAPAASPDSTAIEIAFWNSIQDSGDPADFEAYLRRFPSGSFAGLARNRIESLARPVAARVPPAQAPPAPPPPAKSAPAAPKLALAAPDAGTTRAGSRGPRVGDQWVYRLFDERRNETLATITHEIAAVGPDTVTETLAVAGKAQRSQERSWLDARMLERQLAPDLTVTEFAPFLAARGDLEVGKRWSGITGLADLSAYDRWAVEANIVGRERIRAGGREFDAYKVAVDARRAPPGSRFELLYITRIALVAWYAPEAGRVVKTVRKTYNLNSELMDTDRYELVSFQLR